MTILLPSPEVQRQADTQRLYPLIDAMTVAVLAMTFAVIFAAVTAASLSSFGRGIVTTTPPECGLNPAC